MPRRLAAVAGVLLACIAFGGSPRASGEPEVRAFWVDTFNPGIKTRAEIENLVARAVEANANTIVAQVRRRGDSYYFASREPFVEDRAVEPGLDPLAELIARAHAAGIEVHAWVIANAIYSGNPAVATATWPCRVPCDANHVFNTNGFFAPGDDNWLTRTHPAFTAGTIPVVSGGTTIVPRGWRLSDGNWWMDPGHPAAAEHLVGVIRHLVANYDIDGLHLDRIRYPEMPIARPFVGGPIGFATGYNAVSVRRFNGATGRAAGSLPDPWDGSWSEWRREQMNALVRRIYLETVAIKPHVKVSAATITFFRGPNTLGGFHRTEAYTRVYQDWDGWMRQGWLDMNMPMVYKAEHAAETRNQFNDWTDFARRNQYGRQSAIGIAAYLNAFENSFAQIERSRESGAGGERAAGQVLYSYATTNAAISGVPLRPHTAFFRALSTDGLYTPAAPYAVPAAVPPMPWKTDPRRGHLLAQIIGAGDLAADGAVVVVRQVGEGPRVAEVSQTADGNGYIGAADLLPGAYALQITTPAGTEYRTLPEPVVPGKVTRVTVRLTARAAGPMLRAEPPAEAVPDEVSPLELWRAREPLADDLAGDLAGEPSDAQQ